MPYKYAYSVNREIFMLKFFCTQAGHMKIFNNEKFSIMKFRGQWLWLYVERQIVYSRSPHLPRHSTCVNPLVGEVLQCNKDHSGSIKERSRRRSSDFYTAKNDYSLFLQRGPIDCMVTGARRYFAKTACLLLVSSRSL